MVLFRWLWIPSVLCKSESYLSRVINFSWAKPKNSLFHLCKALVVLKIALLSLWISIPTLLSSFHALSTITLLDSSVVNASRNLKGRFPFFVVESELMNIGLWSDSYVLKCSTTVSWNILSHCLSTIALFNLSLIFANRSWPFSQIKEHPLKPRSIAPIFSIKDFRKSLLKQVPTSIFSWLLITLLKSPNIIHGNRCLITLSSIWFQNFNFSVWYGVP